MDKLEKLLHGKSESAEEFLVREEQVNRQGRVNLDEYSIFRVAYETLDTQVLLDFPEENFNLPAVFVNVGNGFC